MKTLVRLVGVVFLGIVLLEASPVLGKVQGGPGTPIMHVNPVAASAGWPITVSGGPKGPGTTLNVLFDTTADGTVVGAPVPPCLISPVPSTTLALTPPGYHVISSFGAKQVFLTSSPATNGIAAVAPLGQNLTINGLGFAPNSPITITFFLSGGGTRIFKGIKTKAADGSFTTTVFISYLNLSGLTYGVWQVTDGSNNFAFGTMPLVSVTQPPTLAFLGNQGPMGAKPTVTGNYYPPNVVVNILLNSTNIGTTTTNAQGSMTAVVTIPSGFVPGQYAVQAVPAGGGMGGGWSTYTIITPTISINPPTQTFFYPNPPNPLPATIQVIVAGKDWTPGDSVTIAGFGTYTANGNGTFTSTQNYTITSMGSFVFTGTDKFGNVAMMLFWAGMITPC